VIQLFVRNSLKKAFALNYTESRGHKTLKNSPGVPGFDHLGSVLASVLGEKDSGSIPSTCNEQYSPHGIKGRWV
jgi:hypothetical protein